MSLRIHAARRFARAVPLVLLLSACGEQPPVIPVQRTPAPADTAARPVLSGDSARHDTLTSAPARAPARPHHVSSRADSTRADSARRGGTPNAARGGSTPGADSTRADSARRRKRFYAATDTVPWPDLPDPIPGALLPNHRIVAFYGNPLSKRMGILGELPPAQMLAKLEKTAAEWARADSTRTVIPALHMIVTVAQASPGADGKYRLRMSDSVIERVARWAEERNWLFFIDIQVAQSSVEVELARLVPFLRRPYVHLALDPEFAMRGGARPGKRIGTMDASEVNHAISVLSDIVKAESLPPKILVVHRFTTRMLTNASKIRRDPNVQVVVDMDGFGSPSLKHSTWRIVVQRDPVQYTGFKLFYKNDKPMLTPSQVITLYPSPVYVQYQ